MRLVLNAGGPDRLSRVQMAQVVAEIRGHDQSLIKHVSASSVCVKLSQMISLVEYPKIIHLISLSIELFSQVDRGVVSPADISMDITKLIQTLKISPTSFKDGVRLTLQAESHSHILQ